MLAVEIGLMIVAYTMIVIAIFLEVVCYKRNLEFLETIGLTISLLLLVIALTSSPFFNSEAANGFTLFTMVLVGLMTPLNVLKERKHDVSPIWRKVLVGLACVLLLAVVVGHFVDHLAYLQYPVVVFLGVSVTLSMVLTRATPPVSRIAHREKIERLFSVALMVLVPLSLVANFVLASDGVALKTGFTIPLVFILMAGSKIWDDVQRLSLFTIENRVKPQDFKNYALTNREQEVVLLLVKGTTYRKIAEELFISMPTVKSHASNIYKKCAVKNRSELTALLINQW